MAVAGPVGADRDDTPAAEAGHLAGVDVAEDGTRFVFDEAPVLENGFPAYGNGFVTQGYIYPAGTLGESDGVLADGSPEYPDLVIGTWTCWGYFIGDGADTDDGPWVITTQVFDFEPDQPGTDTLVTVGMETPAGLGPIDRAVTGGTGDFRLARGQMTQVTLGHNASEGVNATFDFDVIGGGNQKGASDDQRDDHRDPRDHPVDRAGRAAVRGDDRGPGAAVDPSRPQPRPLRPPHRAPDRAGAGRAGRHRRAVCPGVAGAAGGSRSRHDR